MAQNGRHRVGAGGRGGPGPRGRGRTIASRGVLVLAALSVQAGVMLVGWVAAFRVVRDSFGRAIEEQVIEQNARLAERVADLLPEEISRDVKIGTPEWEKLQGVIEGLNDLPAEGFACLVNREGKVLCHPDIRRDPMLQLANLGGELLKVGRDAEETRTAIKALNDDSEAVVSGRIDFTADGTHYVATKRLAGTDLRLLVHQPQRGLVRVSAEKTRVVWWTSGAALAVVLGVTGLGLVSLLRRYDSVHAKLNRQLKENLRIAQDIQRATLPGGGLVVPGYEIAAWCEPTEETGGDTYDVAGLVADPAGGVSLVSEGEADRALLLLADATGHGVGAALAVTQLQSAVRAALSMGGGLDRVVRVVNQRLHQHLPMGRFVTAWLGVLDGPRGSVLSFSAGQGPVLVWRAASAAGPARIEKPETEAWPLGIDADLGPRAAAEIPLAPGDVLLVVSDGIFEASDASGRHLGLARVDELLMTHAPRGAQAVAEAVREAVRAHVGGGSTADDCTLLVLRREPASAAG